jgi:hypothetical protein
VEVAHLRIRSAEFLLLQTRHLVESSPPSLSVVAHDDDDDDNNNDDDSDND